MAKSDAVWGIDVGQCALKAMRCRLESGGERLVADAYDFIEYPKILSQPDADPAALVADAIKLFLSRNEIGLDRIAISVPGQSGLARFIKLPPVESKKIPDIVKFEAKQQIPFALEDVVWDYQQMAGGSEEDGYALETEVGLFAMKRDQVFRALRPFLDANIEVDVIQLTPISLYNYVVFEQMQDLPPPDKFDPEDPPESKVVLSLGTDTTDLVITNGYRVWQRSIPLGGNHFTKAITKEMKVTFTKAEHLKRNALKTDEAKAIFQAMRPVFNDLATEIQRSISFFSSLNKTAKLGPITALGNTMKLRGLQKFLSQNLDMEVVELATYNQLSGPKVIASPAFKDNVMSFGVCYGLCVQSLGVGVLSTNLLPEEIFQDRLIRAKRPWVLAAVAALLFGCGIGYIGYWRAWSSAQLGPFDQALKTIANVNNQSQAAISSVESAQTEFKKVTQAGTNLAGIGERRELWAELLRVISECLPRDPKPNDGSPEIPLAERNELHIDALDCEYFPDLNVWFIDIKSKYRPPASPAKAAATVAEGENGEVPPADEPIDPFAGQDPSFAGAGGEDASATGPTGEGWVIELRGYHYHNEELNNQQADFIRKTLIKNLQEKKINLRDGEFTTQEIGIDYPVLVDYSRKLIDEEISPPGTPGMPTDPSAKTTIVKKCEFVVQFIWRETPASVRAANKEKAKQKATPAVEGDELAEMNSNGEVAAQ